MSTVSWRKSLFVVTDGISSCPPPPNFGIYRSSIRSSALTWLKHTLHYRTICKVCMVIHFCTNKGGRSGRSGEEWEEARGMVKQ